MGTIRGHYDRNADIAWIQFEGFDGEHVYAEETEFGLRERDKRTDQVVALEFWGASQQLPRDLLEGLPPPKVRAAA